MMERILEGLVAIQEKIDAHVSSEGCPAKRKGLPRGDEGLSEEMTNVAAYPEDSNGTTREETMGATED
jgi:hypothetical protein